MAEKVITMDTDWGAKGAQLSGAEVQGFIKGQFNNLYTKASQIENTVDDMAVMFDTQIQEVAQYVNNIEKKVLYDEAAIPAATGGCLIIFSSEDHNGLSAVPYWEWKTLEEYGFKADGVLVIPDGLSPFIVSTQQAKRTFSDRTYSYESISTHSGLFTDFTGRSRTAAIMGNSDKYFGSNADASLYAAPYCYSYSTRYGNNSIIGIGTGNWWLPSSGEMYLIYKYKDAINRCLKEINGAELLLDESYHVSTDHSQNSGWSLHLLNGYFSTEKKLSASCWVRPITTFFRW